ncbi:hypothetical protein HDV00_002779 [Rhizophlyctis rosea]|nr:hypothetical protein HDV00_002779 [Rhizophlyctis rosea]
MEGVGKGEKTYLDEENKGNFATKAGILGRFRGDEATTELNFTHLGIPKHISNSLLQNFSATTPTPMQRSLIPAFLSGSSIMLRDITGSGKSLALITSLLSRTFPRIPKQFTISDPFSDTGTQEITALSKRYTTTIVVVPSRDLAVQLYTWTTTLSTLPVTAHKHLVQCLIRDASIDLEKQRLQLTETPPKIIIGTAGPILSAVKEGHVDVSRLQCIVIDEIDRVLPAIRRYEPLTQKFNQQKHAGAGVELLNLLVQQKRTAQEEEAKKAVTKNDRDVDSARIRPLQVVISSATLNSEVRGMCVRSGWVGEGAVVINNQGRREGGGILHRVVVVGEGGVGGVWEGVEVGRRRKDARDDEDEDGAEREREREWRTEEEMRKAQSKKDKEKEKAKKGSLSDCDPRVLDYVVRYMDDKSVAKALVFVHSSVSLRGVVEEFKGRGVVAEGLSGMADYARVVGVGREVVDVQEVGEGEGGVENITGDGVAGDDVVGNGAVAEDAQTAEKTPVDVAEVVDAKESSEGVEAVEEDSTVEETSTDPLAATPAPTTPLPFLHPTYPTRLLLLTEHEARGLDLPDLTTVFILGPPSSHATYLHMAGRVGRFGRKGEVVTVVGGERLGDRVRSVWKMVGIKEREVEVEGISSSADV